MCKTIKGAVMLGRDFARDPAVTKHKLMMQNGPAYWPKPTGVYDAMPANMQRAGCDQEPDTQLQQKASKYAQSSQVRTSEDDVDITDPAALKQYVEKCVAEVMAKHRSSTGEQEEVTDEDIEEANKRMQAHNQPERGAADNPNPFPGMPETGGKMVPMKGAEDAVTQTLMLASRVGVATMTSSQYDTPSRPPRKRIKQDKQAFDASIKAAKVPSMTEMYGPDKTGYV